MQTNRQSSRLSGAHLRLFVAILLQNETVFTHFKGQLTVDSFAEEGYQLLYRTLIDFHTNYQTLPSFAELWADLETHFENDYEIISEDGRVELEEFLEYAADPDLFQDYSPTHPKMEKFAYKAGERILMHFHSSQLQSTLQKGLDYDQLPFVLQQYQMQLELIKMHSKEEQDGVALTFFENWDKTNPKIIRSTGLGFLDKYLGGGTAAFEAYGLMAPYGTCKTTLAVMLWCTAAQQCYEESLADDWDGRKGLSVLVTYEAALSPEIQHRAAMYAASVNRYSLDKMGLAGLDALSNDPDNPLPYEKSKFSQEISDGVFRPDRARVDAIIPVLNNHTIGLDFSGADPRFPTAGSGGVGEIVQRINRELKKRGPEYYVRNVIIDYLGLMVDRDVNLKGAKQKEDHKTYQEQVYRVSCEISKPFACHAWILHQLSGQANAILSPTKTLHHTDAKGSKSFAENLDFAIVIGNLNGDSMGQIACTKARRFRRMPPSVIQVDGEFNLVRAPDNYHIDGRGQIVDKSTLTAAGANVDSPSYAGIVDTSQLDAGTDGQGQLADNAYSEAGSTDD